MGYIVKIILNIIILFNLTNLGILFAETKCSPIINSNSYWKEFDNNQVINCDFNECFPKNLDAPLVCDAR